MEIDQSHNTNVGQSGSEFNQNYFLVEESPVVPSETFVSDQYIYSHPTDDDLQNTFRDILIVLEPFEKRIQNLKSEADKFKIFGNGNPDAFNALVTELKSLTTTLVNEYLVKLKWSFVQCKFGIKKEEFIGNVSVWFHELLNVQHILSMCQNVGYSSSDLIQVKQTLLKNGLFVDLQPQMTSVRRSTQILKKGMNFNTELKSLNNLEMYTNASQVGIFLLTDKETAKLYNVSKSDSNVVPSKILCLKQSRNIVGGKKKSGFVFKKLKINAEHQPSCKAGQPEKLNKKSALLFLMTVDMEHDNQYENQGTQPVEIWCVSEPFVLTSNSTQWCAASATIFWDTYFRQDGRLPFQTPDELPWKTVGAALRLYFQQATGTSWALTEDNLNFIGSKYFLESSSFNDDSMVNRRAFCRVTANQKESTFWRWLYMIMELISSNIKASWNSGAIMGFIHRDKAEEMIQFQPRGTFLVRFSDTVLGGVTYTLAIRPTPEELSSGLVSGVYSVTPLFAAKENDGKDGEQNLHTLSLERRLLTSEDFIQVICYDRSTGSYRCQPKEQMFYLENPNADEEAAATSQRPYDPPRLQTNPDTRTVISVADEYFPDAMLIDAVMKENSL